LGRSLSWDYQQQTAKKLQESIQLPVQTEWRAMQQQRSLYCPCVDIAIGPFVYDGSCIPEKHDTQIKRLEKPIQAMLNFHIQNVQKLSFEVCDTSFDDLCYKNKSARCLMAIEIEDQVGRKHLIGTAINVIALGRLGIIIACSKDKLNASIRIRRYLWFLSNATELNTKSLLVLTKEQFTDSFNLH
jgi:hypothetical protein